MNTSKKSIITEDLTCCFVCGKPNAEVHHCLYGTGNRKLADKYGLVVGLCYEHHRGNSGVHGGNKELDLELKRAAQEAFTKMYSHEEYMKLFGRCYL